jgi:hypothetical protein
MGDFFSVVRARFGALTQSQVDGFNVVLAATVHLPKTHRAYLLATTWHETARTMRPIEEYGHGKGRAYGVPTGPWHVVYDGRGDVQLTWEVNYAKATKRLRELGIIGLDIDLEKNPELALRADIAAAVLVYGCEEGWFTGKKLSDFDNFTDMRRVVNGTDQAATIASYAQTFQTALEQLPVGMVQQLPPAIAIAPSPPAETPRIPVPGQDIPKPVPTPAPSTPKPPVATLQKVMGVIAALMFALLALVASHH